MEGGGAALPKLHAIGGATDLSSMLSLKEVLVLYSKAKAKKNSKAGAVKVKLYMVTIYM